MTIWYNLHWIPLRGDQLDTKNVIGERATTPDRTAKDGQYPYSLNPLLWRISMPVLAVAAPVFALKQACSVD